MPCTYPFSLKGSVIDSIQNPSKNYISHVHISDTKGINGEEIQINDIDTVILPIFNNGKSKIFLG